MNKPAMMIAAVLALAGCTSTQQGAVVGGLGGAAIGSVVAAPGNRTEGALVGAAVGTVAGALVGRAADPGRCCYRDQYGRRYVANCPRGY
ncbi:YMGG-like glycine zipper-containing protein [Rhizobiaceae sp. 2RAB30]